MTSLLHSFARRGTVIVATLATAALGLAVAPAAHADAAPGSISGTVTLPADGPVATTVLAGVYTFDVEDDSWWIFDTVEVDASDGSYELAGLEPGTYRVGFFDEAGLVVPEYFNDVAYLDDADDIVVDGQPVVGVDATLAPASRITGTITGAITGAGDLPLDLAYVRAYAADPEAGYPYAGSVGTDDLGHYDLGGLAGGTYKLFFGDHSGSYAGEFHAGATTIRTADVVVVETDSVLPGMDVTLAPASSIGGRVTDDVTGDPIGDAVVTAYIEVMVDGESKLDYAASVSTNGDGSYDLPGLRADDYILGFSTDEGYFDEYYMNAAAHTSADVIELGAGEDLSGYDAGLEPASSISGRLTDASGALADALVVAYTHIEEEEASSWAPAGSVRTNVDGSYDLGGLHGDTYRLGFFSKDNTHEAEFFENAADVETATDLVLETGATLAGTDAELVRATVTQPPVTPPVVTPPVTQPPVTPPVVVPPVVTPPVVTPPTDVDEQHPPKVAGAKKVGSTLKAKAAAWVPDDAKVKYQWLVNGKIIKKATRAKLKLLEKFAGKKISVKVTATSPGSLPVSVVTKVGKVKG